MDLEHIVVGGGEHRLREALPRLGDAGDLVAGGVAARHGQRVLARVDTEHAAARSLARDRDGDGTAAGTQVQGPGP